MGANDNIGIWVVDIRCFRIFRLFSMLLCLRFVILLWDLFLDNYQYYIKKCIL